MRFCVMWYGWILALFVGKAIAMFIVMLKETLANLWGKEKQNIVVPIKDEGKEGNKVMLWFDKNPLVGHGNVLKKLMNKLD